MTFTESIRTCLQKYIDFNGRASRPEYWWFVLLTFVLGFIPVIGWILRLALLLPSLSVQARRLHDMNLPAWWLLLLLIPFIGWIALLIMSAFPGTVGSNRYGPDPLRPQQGMGAYGYGYEDPGYPYAPPPAGGYYEPPYDAAPQDYLPEPSEQQYCSQCGAERQPEARFCTVCGTGF